MWGMPAFPCHLHGNPLKIWNVPPAGQAPSPSPFLELESWDMSLLGHVCLVLCLSSVALPLSPSASASYSDKWEDVICVRSHRTGMGLK